MRKNIRYIIIAVVILALLIGVYFAVSAIGNKDTQDDTNEEAQAETLISFDMDEIERVVLMNESGSAELTYANNAAKVENETLPINGESLVYVFANATGVTAEKNLGAVSDLSVYGLDTPGTSVRIDMKDGSTKSYVLGDAVVGGGYYLKLDGDDNVYVSDTYMSYVADYKIETYARTDLISSISADSISVTSENTDGNPIVISKNSNRQSDSMTYQNYVLSSPDTGISLSEYYMTEYVLSFADGVTVNSMEKAHPTDLSAYGLDKPYGTLSFTKDGVTHKIVASKENSDKTAYCMIDDIDAVYVIDFETYLRSLDLSLMEFQEQYLFIDMIDSISEISFKSSAYDLTYKISGKSSDDADPIIVTLDGKAVDATEFKKLYSVMLGVAIKGEVSENENVGESILEINITYRQSGEKRTIVYNSLNVTKAAVKSNGRSAAYYVYTKDLDKLSEAVNAFKNGNPIQK